MKDLTSFDRAVPCLVALDVDKALEFYVIQLGFSVRFQYGQPTDYAGVERDALEIHIARCSDRYIAENTGCYVYVDDIERLHQEYQAKGVRGLGRLEARPWGTKEFTIHDPDGNLIRIGAPVQ